jgi:hypothetical protein
VEEVRGTTTAYYMGELLPNNLASSGVPLLLGDRFAKRSGAAEVYVTEADSVVVDEGDIDARPVCRRRRRLSRPGAIEIVAVTVPRVCR